MNERVRACGAVDQLNRGISISTPAAPHVIAARIATVAVHLQLAPNQS